MFDNVSYIVRFYVDDVFSDEIYHNTESDAINHARLFDEFDGYSAIEIVEYNWSKRCEKQLDVITF